MTKSEAVALLRQGKKIIHPRSWAKCTRRRDRLCIYLRDGKLFYETANGIPEKLNYTIQDLTDDPGWEEYVEDRLKEFFECLRQLEEVSL